MLKRKVILLGLVIVLLLSQGVCLNAQEQELSVSDGFSFISANDYITWPEELRGIYVLGLVDMFSNLSSLELPSIYEIVYPKIRAMSGTQIRKIYDKYLEEHPEELHYSAASTFFVAICELAGVSDELERRLDGLHEN